MFVKEVLVQNQVGLHARPATFFIQKANEYKSSIWVEKDERKVNAKSLLDNKGSDNKHCCRRSGRRRGCERVGIACFFRFWISYYLNICYFWKCLTKVRHFSDYNENGGANYGYQTTKGQACKSATLSWRIYYEGLWRQYNIRR